MNVLPFSLPPGPRLGLDPGLIRHARDVARRIAADTLQYVDKHTTVAVERAALRLCGLNGADDDGVPVVNAIVDRLLAHEHGGEPALARGAVWWLARAIVAQRATKPAPEPTPEQTPGPTRAAVEKAGRALAAGTLDMEALAKADAAQAEAIAQELGRQGALAVAARRAERQQLLERYGNEAPKRPYLYVIVATGNIYEDVVQAQNAARQGADIIAVIRSTGQSLLDYVPHGATTEGFGGTYATQENFRIMRQALDETSEELGRYIRLTNYCSGLCMPEIAALGALERLDMMLNDAMYGILFRDINMKRTLIDQAFSRLINGAAGIVINTGEDNYLTTADAVEEAHAVVASQLINEQFALAAGLKPEQIGLGHAMEINPWLEDGLLFELAQAAMARELFPAYPLKYMPPTKHMTGNIFLGHVQDAMFNLVSHLTGQTIHLVGVLTEAIHTPFLHDRFLALENARYLWTTAAGLRQELEFREGGVIRERAAAVLREAVALLERVADAGLFRALEQGVFAATPRPQDGGRGREGVVARSAHYVNPFWTELRRPAAVQPAPGAGGEFGGWH